MPAQSAGPQIFGHSECCCDFALLAKPNERAAKAEADITTTIDTCETKCIGHGEK